MTTKLLENFLDLLNSFKTFMAQHNETMMQHGEVTRMWNQIIVGLGALRTTPHGVSTKAMMKARLPNSFAGKEMKTN
jgi:hypothetical protein